MEKPIVLNLTESQMDAFHRNALKKYPWIVRENIVYKVEMLVSYKVVLHDESDLDLVPKSYFQPVDMELLDL